MKMKLNFVEIRTLIQATENEELVIEALGKLFAIPLQREKTEGYWKNPIIVLEGKGNPKTAEILLNNLKKIKISNFIEHSDKNKFFLRLDKEKAVFGELVLGSDIQLTFGFEGHALSSEDVAKWMQDFWKIQ